MREVKKAAGSRPNMLITVVLAVIMAVALGTFIGKIMEYNDIKKEKEILKSDIEARREEVDALEYEYAAPMDDKYIESVAKAALGLVNPDEIIVINEVNE